MKKKFNQETNNSVMLNLPTVFLQFVFLIIIMVFMVICCFKQGVFLIILEGLFVIELGLLAFNNHKIYKRKYFTFIYILGAISAMVLTIIDIIKL